jgi:tetratricopeptide repeat protein 30
MDIMEMQSCKMVQNQCCPQETFGNLLLLYCKPSHGLYDLAADVMAENADLTFKHLTQVRKHSFSI